MYSTVWSASLQGLHVEFIRVEADVSSGLPVFHMVGYLSSEVKEAGERVRTAIRNSDMVLPAKKIVVNLSPADVRKRGTAFDLPIAVAILISLGLVYGECPGHVVFVGELSLDGKVRKVPGILPIVMEAQKEGYTICVVPKENENEGKLVKGMQVIGVSNLREVCQWLNGEMSFAQDNVQDKSIHHSRTPYECLDYSDIRGQKLVKRATEVAVAGNHNLLMVGAPGAGKTMIAKRIPTILPPLTEEESMEITKLYSIMGALDREHPLICERPFREVHHTVTKAALIGGGMIPRPGEISMADKGVLFLDELAEFQKPVLEVLRQPLEEHRIRIARARGEYEFPAEVLLVAAMNPCPCGNYPNLNKCSCTTHQIQSYLGKISQPFLDRIDICVEVEKVPYQELCNIQTEENSESIRARVVKAREIQKKRYHGQGILTNSQLDIKKIRKFCVLGEAEERLMRQSFEKLDLTARMYYKILCVARTIADLDGAETIALCHLREAISYRTLDKKYWRR